MIVGAGPRGVIARGLGRSYGDAAQNAGGAVLLTTDIPRVLDFQTEAGLITTEAGVSLHRLWAQTLPHGWIAPVTPGTLHVTVGGAIASDVHGKNHHRDGSFARHVRSLVLETGSGERRVLDPDGTPDEFGATAGGMGLTGVIVEATIQLRRIETTWVAEDVERVDDLDGAMARMDDGDAGYLYSVAWVDCLARGGRLGRAVLMRGNDAPPAALPANAREAPLSPPRETAVSAPPWLPSGLLRPSAVAAFNELYFRHAPRQGRRLVPLDKFLCPLDVVGAWNRLYGPRGLLQYQFVVPFGEERVIGTAIERLRRAGVPPLLAVLKRMGPRQGLLSFPMAGWTLALDMPVGSPSLASALDELDELVATAGGRVYLAKDSRMRPDLLETMYRQLDRWREIRGRLDPDARITSDLSRRLGLNASAP
jgi:decaprenylphospho-beta-D-ribofuranose 2-oxidase